ncbi:MAG TPA: hypothetical protein DEQ40_09090 [Oxalobacteraceae bacterium]|nr:hypothetical protein [Oxalobacteraceae bacterium]
MMGLTEQQSDCLHYLRDYQSLRGISPTFQEIATALHLKSKSGITRLLNALEQKNYIRRLSKRARSIEFLHLGDPCPRCGFVNSPAAMRRDTLGGEQAPQPLAAEGLSPNEAGH